MEKNTLGDSPKLEKSEEKNILKDNWLMLTLRPSRGHLSVKEVWQHLEVRNAKKNKIRLMKSHQFFLERMWSSLSILA